MYKILDKFSKLFGSRKGYLLIIFIFYLVFIILSSLTYLTKTYGPSHFEDEVLYWNAAKTLASGQFSAAEYHHYPPLYPISLAPVFILFSSARVYEAAKILNAIYISSVIFPVYLICRLFLDKKQSLLASILVMLLPTQIVISRSMISENIFYPLFFWTLYLAFVEIFPNNKKILNFQNILLGILSGFLVLTRYIGLAVVPGIWLIWWLRPSSNINTPFLFSRNKIKQAFSIFIPFAVLVGGWVILGRLENISMLNMLGFGITAAPSKLGSSGLLNWIVFYLAYTILIAAPFLGILLTSLSRMIPKNWCGAFSRWLIAILIICLVFLIPVIRHSYRAAYNFPEPTKIQGRYILYFAPLFIITVFAAIKNIDFSKISYSSRIFQMFLSVILIIAAFLIIVRGILILDKPLPPSINSPDGYLFQVFDFYYPLVSILLVAITMFVPATRKSILRIIYPLSLAGLYICGSVMVFNKLLLPRQINNYQVNELIKAVDSKYTYQIDPRDMQLILTMPVQSTYSNQSKWEYTLRF
ncbi:MAG: glycosyltransferase family 39 protein, partial [Candidatus Atribacteria bacterium]|nr:glycosyltransferase family 39 protein [Candidatus Atribacteria bacterium]